MYAIRLQITKPAILFTMFLAVSLLVLTGCGPSYRELRLEAQNAVVDGEWGAARHLFEMADTKEPGDAENLHDLGVCSMVLARQKFKDGNHAAGMREADRAVAFFTRSMTAAPGFQASVIGRNRALELKGQFEEALRTAHWAANYIGPSAKQQIWLAKEYEERGDMDNALLRYRQAVAMEPDSAEAHKALGMFLVRTGNKQMAIRALNQSLRLDPTQADVAGTLRSLGEPVPAVDLGLDE
jgi:Flp pilus assembly protein TadD